MTIEARLSFYLVHFGQNGPSCSETNINIDVTSIICDQIAQINTCMTSNQKVEWIQIDILIEIGPFHNKQGLFRFLPCPFRPK